MAALDYNQTYSVHHPNGSQDFPDFVFFSISEDKKIKLVPYECKSGNKPKFNNNPPKNCDFVMYLCDKELYVGSSLMDERNDTSIVSLNKEIERLILEQKELNLDYYRTSLKAIEPKVFPPKFFNKEQNNQKIKNYYEFILN